MIWLNWISIIVKNYKFRYQLIFRINCKLHPWNLGLTGFYTPKFRKLDFTPWSLTLLAIHPHSWFLLLSDIITLMCFIFDKSASKLRHFSDDQAKSWHASKLCSFKAKLKTKTHHKKISSHKCSTTLKWEVRVWMFSFIP